jgi:undecaprenyl-diphosphatase
MNFFYAALLGLVEGITEFLPISSTFHLIFTTKLLQIPQTDFTKLFEVFIQGGAILAVVILYFKELLHNKDLAKKVFLAFLPTATVGFLLYKIIKEVFFESQWLMIGVFLAVGIIFIVVEKFFVGATLAVAHGRAQGAPLQNSPNNAPNKPLKSLSFRHAVLIGFVQALAVIPGVSRSGSVIVGMLFLGYDRSEAAKFSFMLSIPTILAASAYDLYKMRDVAFANLNNINLLAVGFVVSFIFALISVQWLIKFLQTHTLLPFGIYRLILAAVIIFSFFNFP